MSYKGYCIKCKKGEDADKVFEIKSLEYSKCFCPRCFAEYAPAEAYQNYLNLIKNKLEYANNLFYRYLNFSVAYQAYADVLTIEKNNIEALLGRILSLICLSTVRKAFFVEATEMISMNSDLFSSDGIKQFYEFASKAIVASSFYLRKLKKRLRYSNRFYDEECVSLYLQRVRECLVFYNIIKLLLLKKKVKIESDRVVMLAYEENIQYLKEVLRYEYLLINGSIYKLLRFSSKGIALISKKKEKRQPLKSSVYSTATLNLEDKDRIAIKNYIFNSWQTLLSWNIITLPLGIIFGVSALAFSLLSILTSRGIIQTYYFPLFIVLASFFGVCSISFLTAKIILSRHLKKKKMKMTVRGVTFSKR